MSLDKPLRLFVYNSETDKCREVMFYFDSLKIKIIYY